MNATTLKVLAEWSGGQLVQGDPTLTVDAVCTDSRAIEEGSLFIALRGDRFDGHAYLEQAADRGSLAVCVEGDAPAPVGVGVIRVQDTLRALQDIARSYRRTLSLKAIGLTGSNGKTSTKDMAAAVLARQFSVAKTAGNLNNHIGVPLTLLRADDSHEVGIFEMGMNHPGEIAPLAALVKPDIGIITNVGTAHIEFMGSRENIAREKGELAAALAATGTLILPAGDEFVKSLSERTSARVVLAGIESGDVQACDVRTQSDGTRFRLKTADDEADAFLRIPGLHMVRNAVLAAAAGWIEGLSMTECAAGLANTQLTPGRMECKVREGILFLDDTYNANPDSMVAALETLARLSTPGKRYAVLGRMGELGSESDSGHRRVGEAAAKQKISGLIVLGDAARPISEAAEAGGVEHVFQVETHEEAIERLREMAGAGDAVLVKGSRTAAMEKVVNAFACSERKEQVTL